MSLELLSKVARPLIQGVFGILPLTINNIFVELLGELCYSKLIGDVDLTDIDCLKMGISKALGIAIVIGGSLVKLPQIIKLINSQSAAGISFTSYVLETLAYFITLTYNVRYGFPFSTFGETALIAVQNVIIMNLLLHFANKRALAAQLTAVIAFLIYFFFFTKVLSLRYLALLQAATIPISLFSKIPQILENYKKKSTGQLSAFTVFNYLLGSLARLFTTLQEVDDNLILIGFAGATVLNLVLAIQMILYWKTPKKVKKSPAKSVPLRTSPRKKTRPTRYQE